MTVNSLRPVLTEGEMAEELADFFAGISQSFPPLNVDRLPRAQDREIHHLTIQEVMNRLSKMKSPKSAVSIDPLPRLLSKHLDIYVEPLTPVINALRRGADWPSLWAKEEVTIIPKTAAAFTFEECRNVSCTSVFSKL